MYPRAGQRENKLEPLFWMFVASILAYAPKSLLEPAYGQRLWLWSVHSFN